MLLSMEEDFFGCNKKVTIELTQAEAVSLAMSYILSYKGSCAYSHAELLANDILNQVRQQISNN